MFFMQGKIGDAVRVRGKMCMSTSRMHTGPPGGCMGRDLIFIKQAQLRLCKLGPGTGDWRVNRDKIWRGHK